MSVMSEIDSDPRLRLILIRISVLERILETELKIPKEKLEQIYMEEFNGCFDKNNS